MNKKLSYDNRICYERQVLKLHALHQKNIQNATPTCNTYNTGGMGEQYLVHKNRKRAQKEKERQLEILRENHLLSHKMEVILHRQDNIVFASSHKASHPHITHCNLRNIGIADFQESIDVCEKDLEDGCGSPVKSPQKSMHCPAQVFMPGVRLNAAQTPMIDCHLSSELSMGRGNACKKSTLRNKGKDHMKKVKLTSENERLWTRLKSQKPTYNTKRWDTEWKDCARKHQHIRSRGTVGYLLPSHGCRGTTYTKQHARQYQCEKSQPEWDSSTSTKSNATKEFDTAYNSKFGLPSLMSQRNGIKSVQKPSYSPTKDNSYTHAKQYLAAKDKFAGPNRSSKTQHYPSILNMPISGKFGLQRYSSVQSLFAVSSIDSEDASEIEVGGEDLNLRHQGSCITSHDNSRCEGFDVIQYPPFLLAEFCTNNNVLIKVEELQIDMHNQNTNSIEQGDNGILISGMLDGYTRGQYKVSIEDLMRAAHSLDNLEVMIKLEAITSITDVGQFPRVSTALTNEELRQLIFRLLEVISVVFHPDSLTLELHCALDKLATAPDEQIVEYNRLRPPSPNTCQTEMHCNGSDRVFQGQITSEKFENSSSGNYDIWIRPDEDDKNTEQYSDSEHYESDEKQEISEYKYRNDSQSSNAIDIGEEQEQKENVIGNICKSCRKRYGCRIGSQVFLVKLQYDDWCGRLVLHITTVAIGALGCKVTDVFCDNDEVKALVESMSKLENGPHDLALSIVKFQLERVIGT